MNFKKIILLIMIITINFQYYNLIPLRIKKNYTRTVEINK